MRSRLIAVVWASAALAGFAFTACKHAMNTGKRGSGGATSVGGSMDAGATGGAGLGGSSVAPGGAGGLASGGAGGGFGGSSVPSYGGDAGGGSLHDGGNGGSSIGGYGGGRAGAGGTAGASTAMGGIGGIIVVGGAGASSVGGKGGQAAGGSAGSGGTSVGGSGGMTFPTGGTPNPGTGEPPKDWTPPVVADVGTRGWQQSTSPLCDTTLQQKMNPTADAWADERGVFLLISDSYDGVVYLNSGSGWRTYSEIAVSQGSALRLLGGFPGGRLVLAGYFQTQYGIAFLDDKEGLTFQTPAGVGLWGFAAAKDGTSDAFVAAGSLLKYSAGTWSPIVSQDLGLTSVWTDGKTVVAVGWDQTIVMGPVDGPWLPLKGVPAADYFAVWGFGPNDLWFGNSGPQLVHYDGSKWELHETGALSHVGIQQLWGESGILYFATDTEFGRWNGTRAEVLLRPPPDADGDLANGRLGWFSARSAKDVFIPLRDKRYWGRTCGSTFMLWFDGAQFHAF